MDYQLFDEYITLQALLKETGVIQSGGAVKAFLAETEVFFNGQLENRRGKKLRLGDQVVIPTLNLDIRLTKPSLDEIRAHQEAKKEKERVAKLVKQMNKSVKKSQPQNKKDTSKPKQDKRKPVRFPGT